METEPIKIYIVALLLIMKMYLIAVVFLAVASNQAAAKGKRESEYQQVWCDQKNGVAEYRLPDKTRVDCLTEGHAIEFDFGAKWAESIGQSLYYSLNTGKRAGVVLILKKRNHYRYWLRLNTTIDTYKLPIDTWVIYGFKQS